jgi:hypothetical protein
LDFREVTLPDAWIKDLFDKAEDGDRDAEAVLCTYAAAQFFNSNGRPLEIWLFCRLEERARKYERSRGRSADENYYRDMFIGWAVDMLCEKHPGLHPTRFKDAETDVSACAIVSKGLKRAGIDLDESGVEKVWEKRQPQRRSKQHNKKKSNR